LITTPIANALVAMYPTIPTSMPTPASPCAAGERYRAPIASGIVISPRASPRRRSRLASTQAPMTLVTDAGSTMYIAPNPTA
jgi:hypothetical protein